MRRLVVSVVIGSVVVTLTGVPRPAAAAEPGRGTGHSLIRALDVRVGDSLSVALVRSEAQSTLDAARAGAPENRVFREFVGADVTVLGNHHTLPSPPWQVAAGASDPGSKEQDTAALEAHLPGGSTPLDAAIGDLGLATTLPSLGETGWLADATLTPSRIEAGFDRSLGGSLHAALNVGSIRILDGLVGFENIGPGEIRGATDPDTNSTGARGLEVGEVALLDLDALLGVAGLDGLTGLPLGSLARLSDKLGLSPSAPDADLSSYGSWEAAVDAMESIRADLDSAVLGGLGCLGLSSSLQTRIDLAFQALGRSPLDCLSGILVNDLASDFAGVIAGLADYMVEELTGEPLLRLTEVGGNTEAVASVTADGQPDLSSTAWAHVGSIFVGGEDVGGFAADVVRTELDELEAAIDAKLADTLGVLGAAYSNLVTVDILPVLTKQLSTLDDYAIASARVALLAISVTPPGTVAHDLQSLLGDVASPVSASSAAIGDGGTVDLTGVTPASAVSPAPSAHGQVELLEPVTMVLGSLVSEAEHTRPGVDFPDEDLPQTCDGATCVPTPDPTRGAAAPTGSATDTELPRTGSGRLMALGTFGMACAMAGMHLRRLVRRIERSAQPSP